MTIPVDAGQAHALDVLIEVDHRLADTTTRLADVAARAVGIAGQTDWRTDAARRFHAQADDWCQQVGGLEGEVELARSEIASARHGLQLQAWGWGL